MAFSLNTMEFRIRESEGLGKMFYPQYRYKHNPMAQSEFKWKHFEGIPVFWSLGEAQEYIDLKLNPPKILADVYHPYP